METIGLFEMLFLAWGPVFVLGLLVAVLALLARILFQSNVEQDATTETKRVSTIGAERKRRRYPTRTGTGVQ